MKLITSQYDHACCGDLGGTTITPGVYSWRGFKHYDRCYFRTQRIIQMHILFLNQSAFNTTGIKVNLVKGLCISIG
jgi:hypothetical protein